MHSFIRRFVNKFTETKWSYILNNSSVRVVGSGQCEISSLAIIKNCHIYVGPNSVLKIKDNVKLDGVGLFVYDGILTIGEFSIIECEKNFFMPEYIIDGGSSVMIADHVRLHCQRLWTRFQGKLTIGSYTNINAFSEVRCDESVTIGGYCQISYNNRIWDTNTHCILSPEERKKHTRETFPCYGHETSKPITKPVIIGEGCWLGENVSVLKGTCLGDDVIVGFNTIVSNKTVEKGKKILANLSLKIF